MTSGDCAALFIVIRHRGPELPENAVGRPETLVTPALNTHDTPALTRVRDDAGAGMSPEFLRNAAGDGSHRAARSRVADSWRALACLGVVLFHGCNTLSGTHPWLEWAAEVFSRTGPRLSIFFVVSGYCLTVSIERRAAAGSGPLEFFRNRFLRIYPIYWVALLLAFGLGLLATPFNGRPASEVFPATPLAWLGDITLTSLWLGHPPKLVVMWFLNHLVGLYLVYGLALLFRSPTNRFSFYAAVTAVSFGPFARDYLPALELWPQFACGIALALALRPATRPQERPQSWRFGPLLYPLVYGLVGAWTGQVFPVYAAATSLLLGLSLRWQDGLPNAPCPLLAVAAASYSIYLVHVTVMSPALNLARRLVPADSFGFVIAWAAHLVLGVVAGLLFFRFIERPLQRYFAPLSRPLPT